MVFRSNTLDAGLGEDLSAGDPVNYTDAAFVAWRVIERDARGDPGHRADHCLIFSSAEVVRRVWGYPPAWRELSGAELEALSWTA